MPANDPNATLDAANSAIVSRDNLLLSLLKLFVDLQAAVAAQNNNPTVDNVTPDVQVKVDALASLLANDTTMATVAAQAPGTQLPVTPTPTPAPSQAPGGYPSGS